MIKNGNKQRNNRNYLGINDGLIIPIRNNFKIKPCQKYIYVRLLFLLPMYFYMRDRYHEDKQLKHINAKYAQDPSSLSEYEYLVLKSMNHLKNYVH